MVKMNFTNNQVAFEYAMYMMLGSYFNKVTCKNYLLEKKMYVQYIEQKEKKQLEMEGICLRYIEKELLPNLPEDIWQQDVEVHFAPTKLEGLKDIQFHGPKYVLRISGIYGGRYDTPIKHQMKMKTQVQQKDAGPELS